MKVIRDVLDHQVVDCNQTKMGRVDGIVVQLRDGQPPRLAYIEIGMPTLGRRLHPQIGRWVATLLSKWGPQRDQSYRIPWNQVRDFNIGGTDVEVDLDAEATPAFAWEKWLREHVVGRIPGGNDG